MHEYILEALEIVSAWDVPDEDFAQAVTDQADLLAGLNMDDYTDNH